MPYKKIKRRVIFQKHVQKEAVKPKNIIIQWEAPQINLLKQFQDLGIRRENPQEYIAKYGRTLTKTEELPDFIREITPPSEASFDFDQNELYDLEGDLFALRLIDLEKEGLGEYKRFLKENDRLISSSSFNINSSASISNDFKINSQSTRATNKLTKIVPQFFI